MSHLTDKEWITGSGEFVDFYNLLNSAKTCVLKGSKIFIGTDSFITNEKIRFATAICFHGGDLPGRYFFYKECVPKTHFDQLATRITEETRRSVELADFLMTEYKFHPDILELHLDVSPFHARNGTSKFSEMLKGYVQGYGFECKLKPDAWASQTIADKHSK